MDVLMPQLGETVAEGKVSTWFKSVGDAVNAGENLFEVETDKTAMEVPTLVSGVVAEIRVPAGETVPVGTIVAVIDRVGDPAALSMPKMAIMPSRTAQSAPASRIPAALITPMEASRSARISRPYDPFREVRAPERNYGPARLPNGVAITPLARRLATERDIDVDTLQGSGPNGRVVAKDVEEGGGRTRPVSASNRRITDLFDPASFEMVPHEAWRRVHAAEVEAAKRSIPHFYLRRDVSLDPLLALIERVNVLDPAVRIDMRACLVKTLALALVQVPEANVRWSHDHTLRFRQADIAVAAASGDSKVIRAAEGKGLGAISGEIAAEATSDAEQFPGVAEVWDMSAAGVAATAAIVRPPRVTALTLGAIGECAVVRDGDIAVERRGTLILSCDHRAIDGVVGAQLISACAALLQRPMMLIL